MKNKDSVQDISTKRAIKIEVTQQQIDDMRARGIDEDAIPAIGKHTYHRRSRRLEPARAKIKITMFIDADVLQHFRKRSEQPDAPAYQTQINSELRATMERDLQREQSELTVIEERLVNNPRFIEALSEKLRAA